MSFARALAAINLQATDRIPQSELMECPQYIQHVSGIDVYEQPAEAYLRAIEVLDLDWTGAYTTSRRFEPGVSVVDPGDGYPITPYGMTGSKWHPDTGFSSPEEVLAYRPLEDTEGKKISLLSPETRRSFRGALERNQAYLGDRCLGAAGYYTTLFQWGIMGFGWENFLLAAKMDPDTFDVILWQFAEISRRTVEDLCSGDFPVYFSHDDVATSRGLVFSPEWYRRYLYPKYEMILEPAKRAGKKLVYVSDGNYRELMPDLFAVGFDGLFFDERNDLEDIIRRWGRDKILVGNVDIHVLTWGTADDIRREVRRCCDRGRECPGYFLKCFGDIPENVPIENLDIYFDACHTFGRR